MTLGIHYAMAMNLENIIIIAGLIIIGPIILMLVFFLFLTLIEAARNFLYNLYIIDGTATERQEWEEFRNNIVQKGSQKRSPIGAVVMLVVFGSVAYTLYRSI